MSSLSFRWGPGGDWLAWLGDFSDRASMDSMPESSPWAWELGEAGRVRSATSLQYVLSLGRSLRRGESAGDSARPIVPTFVEPGGSGTQTELAYFI